MIGYVKSALGKPKRKKEIGVGFAEAMAGYALAGPALVLVFLLMFGPLLAVFAIALTDWEFGVATLNFIGLANFYELFSDASFTKSIVATLSFVAIVVPGTIILAFLIAVLIESDQSLQGFYRAAHFIPFMATLAAMSIVWESLLHPTIGLVKQIFDFVGIPSLIWLRDTRTALPTLAIIGIWQNLGFAIVLFIAGLKAIPEELYHAADVDGADGWYSRLTTVTLPMIGSVALFITIITAIRALETFDTVKVLTQGGPDGTTEVLLFKIYKESFKHFRAGYGSAVAIVFLLILTVITLLQARFADKKVHYS